MRSVRTTATLLVALLAGCKTVPSTSRALEDGVDLGSCSAETPAAIAGRMLDGGDAQAALAGVQACDAVGDRARTAAFLTYFAARPAALSGVGLPSPVTGRPSGAVDKALFLSGLARQAYGLDVSRSDDPRDAWYGWRTSQPSAPFVEPSALTQAGADLPQTVRDVERHVARGVAVAAPALVPPGERRAAAQTVLDDVVAKQADPEQALFSLLAAGAWASELAQTGASQALGDAWPQLCQTLATRYQAARSQLLAGRGGAPRLEAALKRVGDPRSATQILDDTYAWLPDAAGVSDEP